ncbi:Rv3654c family TadE-like protein [Couchioplanes azureus]|uniref:Rv3654c family TadE-like protein n=1 Tax=Couchioplanes caeruleus TaxID=56438 RepID=UPI0027E44F3E|nr:Rv3654c family TadE-like protein [Couchioplanes caeruleus]
MRPGPETHFMRACRGAASIFVSRMGAGSTRTDRGAASIFVLAVGLVLVAGGVAGAAVGAARVGRHEARTAADLGALAGAMRAVEGRQAACARAAEIAAANGGRLTSCRLDGFDVVIEVETVVTPLPGLTTHASAAARAGPIRG